MGPSVRKVENECFKECTKKEQNLKLYTGLTAESWKDNNKSAHGAGVSTLLSQHMADWINITSRNTDVPTR